MEIHEYEFFKWTALALEEYGVTIKIDSNGDGKFEFIFISDNTLTREEYIKATEKVEGDGGGGNGGGGGGGGDDDVSAIPLGNYYLLFMVISIISVVILTKRKAIFSKK